MKLNEIDRGIKNIAKVGKEFNNLVQTLAVAIIDHAAGAGKGDVTRALALVKEVDKTGHRADRLAKFFLFFGGIGMNVDKNEVRIISDKSARHPKNRMGQAFDLDGAKANNWWDQSGPHLANEPRTRVPDTLLELGDNIVNFCNRTRNYIKDDNRFVNDEEQRKAALAAVDAVEAIGKRVAAATKATNLRKEADELEKIAASA